ncbi:MAG: methionyl-tRNA formyltransferase [Cyanomargarita calcarea GSE-NOS-MK-12-04C]|jgi:methionyl-tRNA formyltransferase|uniref:Methionyl-tRNA formyltransferase n=1 Tax=Cyanomargarita calcarea GSE-NOS-MK-12-04C TaxID=2839659 RepID=A0A951UQP9_9CYAN|nr:methionyl-tRNA formyltransferase [Cyanomargarita calcarea GSE-NOS-MK-12-04C]
MTNVLLIGLGTTTLTALQSLISQCNVQGIVRNVNTVDDPVVSLAQQAGIPIFSDTSQEEIKSLILKFQPDCVVVSSYNQILPPALIELTAFINVHYSPLPQYRGRANVNWAIINDEPCAAISIHQIAPGLDEGNILFQQIIPIHFDDTVADIYDSLNQIQRQHLGETVVKALNGYQGLPQNSAEATYGCTRLLEDGEINWSNSTRSIKNLIRGLVSPFPGAYTYLDGKKLTVWQAKPVDNPPTYVGRIAGRVIGRSKTEGYVDVLTGDGVLRILEVQFAGEEKTTAANLIKSVKTTLGLQMSELLNRIQILEEIIIKLQENAK